MKIAVFTPTFLPTLAGAEIALYNILNDLSKYEDVEIHLFLPYMTKMNFDKKGPTVKYKVHSLPPKFVHASLLSDGLSYFYFLMYYTLFYKKISPDIVWFHLFFPLGSGISKYFHKRGIPYVIAGRGVDIQKDQSVGYGYRLDPGYEKRIINIATKASKVICISESIAEDFLSVGVNNNDLVMLPNAIDTERLASISIANLSNELEIDPDRKVIITVGRYTPKKGYECVPDIIRHLLKTRSDFVWLIVGEGVEENLCLDDATAKHVKFLTQFVKSKDNSLEFPDDKLIGILKASDIFAYPTIIEGLANVALEAMAANLVVITSDVPGCRDIITDGHDGILIEPGDSEMFASSINDILNDDSKADKLRASGLKTVSRFSRKTVVDKYYHFLKQTSLKGTQETK